MAYYLESLEEKFDIQVDEGETLISTFNVNNPLKGIGA